MEDLQKLLSDFQKARGDIDSFIKNDLPRIIGVESKKIILQNFTLQVYDSGNGITKWAKRAASTDKQYDRGKTVSPRTGKLSKYRTGKNATFKGSVYSSLNPILVQTHTLKNSIHYRISNYSAWIGVSGTFTGINKKSGEISTYAKALNEGDGHLPRRQFMPFPNQPGNPKIIAAVTKKTSFEIEKRMKKFK